MQTIPGEIAVLKNALVALGLVLLVALAALAAPARGFAPARDLSPNGTVTSDLVPMLECEGNTAEDLGGLGTGTRIDATHVLTAGHVASIGNCRINGEPILLVFKSVKLDVAIFKTLPHPGAWPALCEPLHFGEAYTAYGYALGGPLHREVVLGTIHRGTTAAADPGFGDTGLFVGSEKFIPGMSGGPIVNSRGQLVGVIVGYENLSNISLGRMLADTPLCGAPDVV